MINWHEIKTLVFEKTTPDQESKNIFSAARLGKPLKPRVPGSMIDGDGDGFVVDPITGRDDIPFKPDVIPTSIRISPPAPKPRRNPKDRDKMPNPGRGRGVSLRDLRGYANDPDTGDQIEDANERLDLGSRKPTQGMPANPVRKESVHKENVKKIENLFSEIEDEKSKKITTRDTAEQLRKDAENIEFLKQELKYMKEVSRNEPGYIPVKDRTEILKKLSSAISHLQQMTKKR